MVADAHLDWAGAAASALEWWHDAGVDMLVDDLPRNWLAAAPSPASATPVPVAPVPAAMPDGLEAFLAWRGGDDAPEAKWSGARVLASGPADADLCVFADWPDREDCAAGQLLTGAAGRLFDAMLAAVGVKRADVHLVSVCVRRPPAGRIARDGEALLHEVARRHVALVAPKRLLLLGDAASCAVLGANVIRARGRSHPLNHKEQKTAAVATFHPRFLLDRPADKAGAWRDLLLLFGDGA